MVNFKIANEHGARLTATAGMTTMVVDPGETEGFTPASGDQVMAKTVTRHYGED
jgi:hypothetical protein